MGKPYPAQRRKLTADAATASPVANPRLSFSPRPGVLRRGPVVNDSTYAPGGCASDAERPAIRRGAANSLDRTVQPVKLPPGTRPHERRWRDASIILVERRKGELWKYGSIVLCVALWVQVWLMFRAQ